MNRKFLIYIVLLFFNYLSSQQTYKTILEGTYWGQPFELRQVTLSEQDGCSQFSHSQILWYFKNENEPNGYDIGTIIFNQLNDWREFKTAISSVASKKEVGFSKTNKIGKKFFSFIDESNPLFVTVVSIPENKKTYLRKNFFSTDEVDKRYLDKIDLMWQNDLCEGGVLID